MMYKVVLSAEAESLLTFQSYGAQPAIEGLWQRLLKKHRSENGWFMEHLRAMGEAVEGLNSCVLRQISISAATGRINTFHTYPKEGQGELRKVVGGQLLVWFVDCRASSSTEGARPFMLSGEKPTLLHIRGGSARGYNSGHEGGTLLYVTDPQFNLQNPDEGCLPWDPFGAGVLEEDRA